MSKASRFLPVLIIALATHLHAISIGDSGRMTLPPMAKAPVIDGKIDAVEWQEAGKIIGFLDRGNEFGLEPRQGYTRLGYDQANLYLAMSSELPPDGKLLAKVRRDDAMVHHDDSIELWLDPNRSNRAAKTGDQRYYQIIFNSLGTKLDVMIDPAKGVPNSAWTLEGYQFANRINTEQKTWELELAIPWKALGKEAAPADGQEIGVLMVRDWQRPWGQAGFSLAKVAIFTNLQDYAAITLHAGAPIIQEETLGNPFEANFDYHLAIRNPQTAEARYKVETAIQASDMPTKTFAQDIVVAGGKTEALTAATVSGSYHKTATNTLSARVTSVDGKTVFFEKKLTVKPARERIWSIVSDGDEAVGYSIAYYPTLRKLAVKLDLAGMADSAKVQTAQIEVLDAAKKAVLTEPMPVDGKAAEKLFALPELTDGTYLVRATLKGDGVTAKPLEKNFLRQHFPWENNTLGITNTVFAPFTPVKAEGDVVETVLRRHTMNHFGLWDSVVAKGRELLAASMTIQGEAASGKIAWSFKKSGFTSQQPNLAVYETEAESAAVTIHTTSRMEEDGCMRVEMKLLPGSKPEAINSLSLDIPVKDELAPFWHVIIAGECRGNPVGNAPAGTGTVWNSTQTGNGVMLGNFLPFIWLGGPERGITWFANNDRGWRLDDKKPAQELIRENGRLILRLHLINQAGILEQPRTIVFGLQATPAKPLPEDWRNKIQTIHGVHGGANIYWGIVKHYAGKYPIGRDYTIVDEMVKVRQNGGPNPPYFETWLKEKVPAGDPQLMKEVRASVNGGFNMVRNAKMDPQFIYYEENGQDTMCDEWRVFQDEWGTEPYTARKWKENVETYEDLDAASLVSFYKTYADFSLWYTREWFRRGFSNYSDNCFPRGTCFAPLTSDAYVRDDGQVQPSASIWEMREYYQRMWKLMKECQKDTPFPLLKSYHVTNGMITPVIVWGEVDLDIEWEWQNGMKSFPTDLIQTETTGLQAGNYGTVHYCLQPFQEWREAHKVWLPDDKAMKDPKRVALQRTEWGMLFVHELVREPAKLPTAQALEQRVRQFGYGQPDCEIINYWTGDDRLPTQPVIASSNPQIKWLGLWQPGTQTVLLVLVNWDDNAQKTNLTVKPAKGAPFAAWQDAETANSMKDGDLEFQGREVKFVKIAAQTEGK